MYPKNPTLYVGINWGIFGRFTNHFYSQQSHGKSCKVDYYKRHGKNYFFAYPQNYARSSKEAYENALETLRISDRSYWQFYLNDGEYSNNWKGLVFANHRNFRPYFWFFILKFELFPFCKQFRIN